MKYIDKIEFTFENCECIEIESKYLGTLSIKDIHKQIDRIACNAIVMIKVAKSVAIEIFSEADREYHPFEDTNITNTIFNRLTDYNDITSITLYFSDGTEDVICVDWSEENDKFNEYQSHYISSLGNLYIGISEDKIVDSMFGDEINDKDFIDDKKVMIFE